MTTTQTARRIALSLTLTALALTAQAKKPPKPDPKACELIAIALDEADMAPQWYEEAGKFLKRCGFKKAEMVAKYRACQSEQRLFGDGDRSKCDPLWKP